MQCPRGLGTASCDLTSLQCSAPSRAFRCGLYPSADVGLREVRESWEEKAAHPIEEPHMLSSTMDFAVTLLALAVVVAVLRRLVGRGPGLARTTVAAVLGVALIGPVGDALVLPPSGTQEGRLAWWAFGVTVGTSFVVAAAALIAWEWFWPSGPRHPLEHPIRSGRDLWRRYGRVAQLLRAMFRQRLARSAVRAVRRGDTESQRQLGRCLRAVLEEGGGTLVKLGQLLAVRPGLVPPPVADELHLLVDQAAPALWPDIEERLRACGWPADALAVEPVPIAAASVAQVHAATASDGRALVVKVVRPGIEGVVESDLSLMTWVATWMERATEWGRAMRLTDLVEGFGASLRAELDLTLEAQAAQRLRRELRHRGDVVIPEVDVALSRQRVMVMERVEGVRASAVADPEVAATYCRTLVGAFLHQVLVVGAFHADPHPGNVLLHSDGRVGLVDFGSVGYLDASRRATVRRLVLAVSGGDGPSAARALAHLVDLPEDVDFGEFQRAVGDVVAGPAAAGRRRVGTFDDLAALAARFRFRTPTMVAALFRCLSTVDLLVHLISPEFDVVAESRRLMVRPMWTQMISGPVANPVLELVATVLGSQTSAAPPPVTGMHSPTAVTRMRRLASGGLAGLFAILIFALPLDVVGRAAPQERRIIGYSLALVSATFVLAAHRPEPGLRR